jgi:LysM domain-containing protein
MRTVIQRAYTRPMPATSLPNSGFSTGGTMGKCITWLALAFSTLSSMASGIAWAQGELKMQENAPDRYVVEKGDTLWGIAHRFLQDPWRWPEIWRFNEQQIRNPHRIYPGDVIVLDRSTNPPRLVLEGGDAIKVSPQIYAQQVGAEAIPSIPARVIEPFLNQPLVIEQGGLDHAPRIIATEESRVNLGPGGIAYVMGIGESKQSNWQIFRPGRPLVDPDTGLTLGIEAIYLGMGRVVRSGEPATLQIVAAIQEIGAGDRLIALGTPISKEYAPRAPNKFVQARIISLYDRLPASEGGPSSIVSLNKGSRDGLENGHVLAIYRTGATVYPSAGTAYSSAAASYASSSASGPPVKLPDERYGLLFVFRTFDAVSYALVMQSSRPVTSGDRVQTP